jgi:small-conductance mechanosensitive channel
MEHVFDNLINILETWWTSFQENLPQFIAGLIVLILSFYLARFFRNLTNRALERRNADPELSLLVSRVVRWGVIILGIVLALQQAGQDVSALLAGLGILGFTIGFALQDISANFVAGILLLIEQPFNIGDTVEIAGYTGTIGDVDLRATEIVLLDGKLVIIPNRDVFTNAIVNYSRTDRRRVELKSGVAYGSDLEDVREVALEAIKPVPGLLNDPSPELVFEAFGDSAIMFTLYYWFSTDDSGLLDAQDAGIVLVNKAFEDAGIEMPYPTQAILLRQER